MANTPLKLQQKINRIMRTEYAESLAKDPNDGENYVIFLNRVIVNLDNLKKRYMSGIEKNKRKGVDI